MDKGLQWNPFISDTLGTNISVLITGVNLYHKAQFVTFVSLILGCPQQRGFTVVLEDNINNYANILLIK